VEVMNTGAESQINVFNQQLEKFVACWYQLKPQDVSLEGDHEVCINAMASLTERRAEFDELRVSMEKLK